VKAEVPQEAEPQIKKAEEPQQVPESVPTVTEEPKQVDKIVEKVMKPAEEPTVPKVEKKKKDKPENKAEAKVEAQQAAAIEPVKEVFVHKPELEVEKPVTEPVVKPTEEALVDEEQISPVQKAKVEQAVSMLIDIPKETPVAEVSEEEDESSEEEVIAATPVKPVEASAAQVIEEEVITKDKAPVDKEGAPALDKLPETVPKPEPEEESDEEESDDEESEQEESDEEETPQAVKKPKKAIQLPQPSVTESKAAGKLEASTELVTKEESDVNECTVETTQQVQNEAIVISETASVDEASVDQESITVKKTVEKKSKKSKHTIELPQATVTETNTADKLGTRTEQMVREESMASSQVSVEQVRHEQHEVDEEDESEEEESFKVPSGFSDIAVSDLTNDSVVLSWQAPKDDGGSQITTYIIVMRESDKNKFKKIGQVQSDTFSYQVTKIKEGHEYFFRVYAQNGVGISTESATTTTSVVVPKRKKDKKEKQTIAAEQEVVQEETKMEQVQEEVATIHESVEETAVEVCWMLNHYHTLIKSYS